MKNTKLGIFILLVIIAYTFSACQSINRLRYFSKAPGQSDTLRVPDATPSTIQPGDILGVMVVSLNSEASKFFNPFPTSATPSTQTSTIASLNASESAGFLVDTKGNIELPLIGEVRVQGLNTLEIKDLIKEKLKPYLKGPNVIVRVLNYRITIMGEVKQPSVYVIPNERITVIEALNLAGDLTELGKRDNIMVIRDVDGKKVVGHLNLNDRSVFNSQYYYLYANDIVYVEPVPGKALSSSFLSKVLPITISAISLIVLLFVNLK